MMFRTRRPQLKDRSRRAIFEELESRQLLSITLPTIADQTVMAGAPLSVALNGSGTDNPIQYTVTVSNSSFDSGEFSATIPQGNTVIRMHVDYEGDPTIETDDISGDMVFQLADDLAPDAVDQIIALVQNSFYNGLTFHRIWKDFMIQGGDPDGDGTGGADTSFDDEFSTDLQFTGSGILALANSGSDTNSSQFFITTDTYRYGDFRYTIIGNLVKGADILEKLENVPVNSNANTSDPVPTSPDYTVTIASVTTITDDPNGLLRLSALDGITGSCDVTVTATDTVTHETASQTFTVTVLEDDYNDPPYLDAIAPIETTVNTPVSFYLPGVDVDGDAIKYEGISTNDDLEFTVDSTTGYVTLTPTNGITGVYKIRVGVISQDEILGSNYSYDLQYVPVYIHPAAPTGITLLSDSGDSDGITSINTGLQFQVNGVLSGAEVQLFANGELIGSKTATDTSVTITLDEAILPDGDYTITATQTLNDLTVDVGNLDTTVDLASTASTALTITIDSTDPQFDFTPITVAGEGLIYSCQVTTVSDGGSAITYQLLDAPDGMTIDPESGLIAWTPTSGQGPDENVTVQATDTAGNTAETSYTVSVVSLEELPPEITILNGSTVLVSGGTTAIDLGSVIHDATGTSITLTIRNDGGQTLDLTTPFAGATHFTVSDPAVASLGPGESTTFTVTLKTDEVWSGSEEISFVNNDELNDNLDESTFTFLVSGAVTALSPEITLLNGETVIASGQTTVINFGSVSYNATAPSITFTIRNDGEQTLTLTSPFADTAHFTVSDPAATSLSPGETTTFTVTLKTNAVWTGTEEISFANNDGNKDGIIENPFTFQVSGTVTGLPPEITVLHGTTIIQAGLTEPIFVGLAVQSDVGPSITLTIRNDGEQTLTLTTPFASSEHFTVGQPEKSSLAAGETTTFTVTLKTDTAGKFFDQISFPNNDSDEGSFAVVMSGLITVLKYDHSTVGLFNPYDAVFYLKNSNSSGYADNMFDYGWADSGIVTTTGDWTGLECIVGDWNGDGVDTVGLYNPRTSVFYLKNTNNGGYADMTFQFGPIGCGWTPIAGDWEGDGFDTIGLYNQNTGMFYLKHSNSSGSADLTFQYGPANSGWMPIVGDWYGFGLDTIGLYNPTTSTFYLRAGNSAGYADTTFNYGPSGSGWMPIAGDWDVDRIDTIGLYDPISSVFYLRNGNNGGFADTTFNYGPFDPGWMPIVGNWTGGQALTAADGLAMASADAPTLTQADLQPLVAEAISRWESAGLDSAIIEKLKNVQFIITDLPGSYLGQAQTDSVYLDLDAAGHGWFIDSTPARNEEFTISSNTNRWQAIDPQAVDRIDLLSVVEHELGHIAGFEDLDAAADDVMSGSISGGIRFAL